MIQNLLFIFASFGCISASKIKIKDDKFHGRKHISEDITDILDIYKNFFILVKKDSNACQKYAPNQLRCRRVFVNIEALTNYPWWMKIDLQTIMPELEEKKEKIWLFMELNRTYTLFETTVLREYQVSNIHALKLDKNWIEL